MGTFVDLEKLGMTRADLPTLGKSSSYGQFDNPYAQEEAPVAEKEEEPGYGGTLWDFTKQGANSTYASMGITAWAYGGMDNADTIAEHFSTLKKDPAYVAAFHKRLDQDHIPYAEAWARVKLSKRKLSDAAYLGRPYNPEEDPNSETLASNYWDAISAFSHMAKNMASQPKALSVVAAENLANMIPTLGLGGAGFGAGVLTGNPITPLVLGAIGMTSGTVMTITGEKGFDVLTEHGYDLTNAESIREGMSNPDIVAQIRAEGAKKGLTIAAVDLFTMALGGRIITSPGRVMEASIGKAFKDAGVDVAKSDLKVLVAALKKNPELRSDMATAMETYLKQSGTRTDASVSSVTKAAEKFSRSQTRIRGAGRILGATSLEVLGEGVGEYYGEEVATGQGSIKEALLESFTSIGQSAVTVGAIKAITGTTKVTKKALEGIKEAQIDSTRKGENSTLDPAAINEARAGFNSATAAAADQVDASIDAESSPLTPNIAAYEEVLGDIELRGNLDQIVEGLLEEDGYVEYQARLDATLSETSGEEVSIYVALTPEDAALLESTESPSSEIPTEVPTPIEAREAKGAAEIDGEWIIVYDRNGNPLRTKVSGTSEESGQVAVVGPDGQNLLEGNGVFLEPPSSPNFVIGNTAADTDFTLQDDHVPGEIPPPTVVNKGKKVSELDDGQLDATIEDIEKNLAAEEASGGAWMAGRGGVLADLNALRAEKERRTKGEAPVSVATLSRLSGYGLGSLDKTGIDQRPGTEVVRITVPSKDVVSRGNSARGQIIVKMDNIQRAEFTATTPTAARVDTFSQAASVRLGQIDQERGMESYEEGFDEGHREARVEESKKTDPAKTTRATKGFNEGALSWIPSEGEIDAKQTEDGVSVTVPFLSKTIRRFNIPTERGRGEPAGDRQTKREDVLHYRAALESPNSMARLNAVLKKIGYSLKPKNKEIILTGPDGRSFGLGTVRLQDYTIDEYLDFAQEMDAEAIEDSQIESARTSERSSLKAAIERSRGEETPEGRVADNLKVIEEKFVTRKDGKVEIDAAGLDRYLAKTTTTGKWKKRELALLKRSVQRLREESKLAVKSKDTSRPAPRRHVVSGTRPSATSPGMSRVAKLKGSLLKKFHAAASNIISTGNRDGLLGEIAKVFVKQGVSGKRAEGEVITPANILALSPSSDSDLVAKVYALAAMLIYRQDSVTTFRPSSSLDIEADTTSLGGYLKSTKNLNESQFGKLFREVKRIVGEGSELVRIGDLEYTIHNDSLNKSQLARRLGRLQAQLGKTYGFQTEFFAASRETITQDWVSDPYGESLRDQIREAGFSDLLEYIDNRHDAYLELAQEYGATLEEATRGDEQTQEQQIDEQIAQEQKVVAVELIESTNQAMREDPAFALELAADSDRLIEIQETLLANPELAMPEGLAEEDGNLRVSQEYVDSAENTIYGRVGDGGQRLLFALSAEKLEKWIESKVRPVVQGLAENAQNIKFRLPKSKGTNTSPFGPAKPQLEELSDAQKNLYRAAVSKFFTPSKTGVRIEGNSIVASFPLMPSDELPSNRSSLVSTVGLFSAEQGEVIEGTGINGAIRNRDVALWLQERTREQGRIAPHDHSEQAGDQIAQVLLAEIRYQLSKKTNAIGWYEEKVQNMMEVFGVIYPELLTDKHSAMMMKAFLAITSQSTDVDQNLQYAVEQYEHYRNTEGTNQPRIRVFGKGKATKAMKLNHELLAKLVDEKGLSALSDFLEREYTVRELAERGYKVSGELKEHKGRGALVLGPKIGSFFGNLNGHYESLTADLWFSRTWNRITGNLLRSSNVAQLINTQNNVMLMLKDAQRVKPLLMGYNRRELIANEELRLQWAAEFTGEWSRSSFAKTTDDKHLIKRLHEVHNNLQDAPRGGAERKFMRGVMAQVKDALSQDGINATTADLQALIWYHEKDLFAILGADNTKSEATDYEQAARRLLATKRPDLGFDHVLRGTRRQDGEGRSAQSEADPGRDSRRTDKTDRVAYLLGDQSKVVYQPEEPAKGGFFVDRTRLELGAAFGSKNIESLEAQGILKILSNVSELPEELHQDVAFAIFAPPGMYDKETGISYLISENIAEGESREALLHEVGVHFGLKRMLGAKAYGALISQLMSRRGDKALKPYFDDIGVSYSFLDKDNKDGTPNIQYEEQFIEEVIAKIVTDPSTQEIGIVREIYAKIRVFLAQYFKGIVLTSNDLLGVSKGALRQAYKGRLNPKTVIDSGVAFSLTQADPRLDTLDEQEATILLNLLRGGDNVFLRPKILIKKLSGLHKNKAFSSNQAQAHENKKAKVKLDKALSHIQDRVNQLPKSSRLLVNFSTDGATSERFVHLVNADSDTMLTIRFGFTPIESSKLSMLGPVVDFSNMGDQRSQVLPSDLDKAIRLASQGSLAKESALSFYINHRIGHKPAHITGLDAGRGIDNYTSYIKRIFIDRRKTYRIIVESEGVAVDSGFLKERVTPVVSGKRVMFALPDQSTNDVNPRQQALINETNGRTKRWSLSRHIEQARGRWALWATQGAVDRYRGIKALLGEEGNTAWQMMHLSDNAHGLLHAVLNFGRPMETTRDGKFDGYLLQPGSEGLLDVLESLEGEVDRFLSWIVGHRAGQLMNEGREHHFTKDDITNLKNLGKGKTVTGKSRTLLYAQKMKALGKFQKDIVQLSVSSGSISQEDANALLTDFYLPFYREFEEGSRTKVRGPAMNGDFVNFSAFIAHHRLKGSEVQTNDVLENLMMNWAALLNASMKNRAGVAAVDAAVIHGAANLVPDKEVPKIEFGKRKAKSDKYDNYIYVLKGGKKVWYEVNDQMVLKSLLAMNWSAGQLPGVNTLSKFKRVFTYGVTASPAFKSRNLIRDALHSIAVGEMSYNVFGNVAKGMANTKKDSIVYQNMIAGGGAFVMGYLHDDPSALRRTVKLSRKQVQRGWPSSEKEVEERVLDTGKKGAAFLAKGWDAYQDFGNRLENANRVALYMNRVGEVGNMQAQFEARDLLNFSSHGGWVATQYFISGISFLNARVQGLDKLGRTARDKTLRNRLFGVVGTIALASILYELGMEDDEEYQAMENWKKETYWPVRIPFSDGWFLIPKPFEIGAIASVAQTLTRNFINESPNPNFVRERVLSILHDQLAFDWRFQAFKPALEVAMNKDSFRDRPIESLGWRISNISKTNMKYKYTSDVAVFTSELIDKLPGDNFLSPVQADHLIKGYFGWLGSVIPGAVETVYSPIESFKELEGKRLDQMYGVIPVGGYITQSPLRNTLPMTFLYEQLKKVNNAKADYNHYRREGLVEEERSLLAEKGELLQWHKVYNNASTYIGKINKQMKVIGNSELSPLERREELDRLIILKNGVAKRMYGLWGDKPTQKKEESKFSFISNAGASTEIEDNDDVTALQSTIKESGEDSRLSDNLYKGIFKAEFRGLNRLKPFVRTSFAPKDGSSAYGPLQITKGLMESAKDQLTLTEEEGKYVDRFIEQGRLFLKFGKEPDMEGYKERYDYGGAGDLTDPSNRKLYRQVGKKLLLLVWEQAGGDWRVFLNAWRYGEASDKDVEITDKDYFTAFTDNYRA